MLATRPDVVIARLASTAEESRDAAAWNDLGAAYYQQAIRTRSTRTLQDALASADQALLLDRTFVEARFNRALILERFPLREAAADAWRDYLAHAPADEWRDRAIRHLHAATVPLRTVQSELTAAFPRLERGDRSAAATLLQLDAGDARYFGETEGLARWGEAWLRRDAGSAERQLTAMRTLSEALVAFSGETLLRDAVSAIEHATSADRDVLARAHMFCRDGRLAYDRREFGNAEKLLTAAVRDLEHARSPAALEVRMWAGAAMFWQGRHAEGEREFRALQRAVPERYRALRGWVDWQLASCSMARADSGNALLHYTRAIETFTKLQERNNAAYLHNIVSQVYDDIRDPERAAAHRELALLELGKTSSIKLTHALYGMVYDALQRKEWRAARSLLDVQIAVNEKVQDAEYSTFALLRRARLRAHLGEHAGAAADLRAAAAIVAAVKDPAHRSKLEIDCDVVEAVVAHDARVAIPLLTGVIRYQTEKGFRRLVPDLYLRRGRMYLAIGDHASAAADFESGIAQLEQQRETIGRGEQRWGILDSAEELFDEAITEALRSGARAAFAYAERKRARSLADTGAGSFDASKLPAETLLIEYAALPDRLLIFAVDAARCDVREVRVPRERVTALSARFVEALSKGAADGSAELGELLLGPIRADIASHREVAFITDASTAGIPFAALPGIAGRPLIEDVSVSVAPSARQYLGARLRRAQPRRDVLIVDDPANPSFERLDATTREVKAIETEYREARRLTGAAATRDAFVAEARSANVIHFAGHGVTSSESASLLFAPAADDSGRLDAKAISRLDLRHTDVVVLAACDTARGPIRAAEGVLSVTHAFLQAGAPVVVATLWPIDDGEAARFFPRLHRHLARGLPAVDALRQTQLEFLRGSNRSAFWAGIQAIGY
ncbi:MAG TPA: CHAT domain-containing protein [Thermoanaerobaculia bacterium]|nr:CHAT domain-containing protein [Thermoanaerobaculia bacterium]